MTLKFRLLTAVAPFALSSFIPLCAANAQVSATAQTVSDTQETADAEQNTSSDDAGVNDIVVTALKREQSINTVPVTISALSGSDMQKLQIVRPQDLAAHTTGLLAKSSFNGSNQLEFFIRGVGLSDFASTAQPAVAVYIDEIGRPSPAMLNFPLFDMERIEVLKGPQGTLYGRNSTAGAVNLVTRKPTSELDGYARLAISRWGTAEGEAAVGGPIADGLNGRLSVLQRSSDSDGYFTNRFNNNDGVGEIDVTSVRGQLAWNPVSNFRARLAVYWYRDHSDTGLPEHIAPRDPQDVNSLCAPIRQGRRAEGDCVNPLGYFDPDDDVYAADISNQGRSNTNSKTFGLTAEWDLGAISLTSITAYQEFMRDQQYDVDGSPYKIGDVFSRDSIHSFSQELRLSSDTGEVDWIAGAFYSKDRIKFVQNILLTDLLGFGTTNGGLQRGETAAIFANATVPITSKLSITAGARFTHEVVKWRGGSYLGVFDTLSEAEAGGLQFSGIPLVPGNLSGAVPGGPLDFPSTIKDDQLDGRITAEYKPSRDILIYGSFSKGFKSGGYPGAVLFDQTQQAPFGPEKLFAYEAGVKATLIPRVLHLNAAAFYYDYQDWQANFTVSGELNSRLQNAGDVEIKGIEADIDFRPVDGLTLKGGAIFMTNRIARSDVLLLDFATDILGTIQGNKIPNAPKFSANALMRYEMPIDSRINVGFQTDFKYASSHYLEVNNRRFLRENGYFQINARVSLMSSNSDWELGASVQNITNKYYYTAGYDLAAPGGLGDAVRYVSPPRSWTVEFIHRF